MRDAKQRLLLLVLDGLGWAPEGSHNPLLEADIPFISRLADDTPPTLLEASGSVVGLPPGQVGNSEVGHLTIGTGRTIAQASVKIRRAVTEGGFRGCPALADVFARSRAAGTPVHVLGIASEGGAHGHIDHIGAVLDLAAEYNWSDRTYVHAVSDGRDVPARTALEDLARLEEKGARLATVVGRKLAMDRSGRTDRTASVVAALTGESVDDGEAPATAPATTRDWRAAVAEHYTAGGTDEHLPPIVLDAPRIAPGDEIVMTNFRPDGLRQLATALAATGRPLTTMTRYSDDIPATVVFDQEHVDGTLAQAVAAAGLAQVHIAEREKYGHVTYLLNGYTQHRQPGERHIMVASRTDVPSFDLAPEMSAREITAQLISELRSGEAQFLVANIANIDTVGHTGNYDAVRQAAEVVDACLRDIAEAAAEHGAYLVVTADHGNGESMREADGTTPSTRHTSSPVPLWVLGADRALAPSGDLRDIAPTCLHLLGIEPPAVMSGRVL
ncbi:2,3-bisphosphoglycerate-independent phosphoglycerate mutase [Streptomyces aureocirculatus]|uniref:2,3-bisphosphoglycerate-independent phosphoglycerate mutase n=1 Tax=Streptomyces aureocirculatus TaxID=67275 RepID=UPI0004CC3B9F|nr:2,3-bisphosphoglycerate-independent phosphoglycerate mutase [Streptomyces aureocirculatus]